MMEWSMGSWGAVVFGAGVVAVSLLGLRVNGTYSLIDLSTYAR